MGYQLWGGKVSAAANQIGSRTLIAKTCTRCGEFLSADWFSPARDRSGGYSYRRSWCRKCNSVRGGASTVRDRPDVVRRQSETAAAAERSHMEYTQADFKVLADTNLSIAMKAAALGRSYFAITKAMNRLGISNPQTRLDDEVFETWVILNG